MARLWWLWWLQPARPPPQRWRHAGEHGEAPPRVAPPQPNTTCRSATHGRATAAAAAGKAAAVVVVPAVVTQMVARSDEDGGEDGVKILAGKDGGSPEKSAGKVFPAAAAVDRRRLAGN
ncbi:hypothetical protein Tco_0245709 [Tanacetum coccineum]